MNTIKTAAITKDAARKQLRITRDFAAPLDQVWDAWTDSVLLDQWWAPRPWKAETKSMDFREGGKWLYAMVGPDSTRSWACMDYENIVPRKSFSALDAFCDEDGKINEALPHMYWKTEFQNTGRGTRVVVEITFDREADLEKILEMGFEEGFTAALGNLDELLENQQVPKEPGA